MESNRDENFVKELSKKYKVPFFLQHFNTTEIANAQKTSIEETARNLRYDWFYKLLDEHHYDYIATAHHANDNVETVLMNICRGTGVNGLKGILPKQNKIIRPLLFVKKNDIENFANQNDLEFVLDSTNAENDYTRNFFRNELIPSITKVYPEVQQNVLNNIERWKDMTEIYYEKIAEIKSKLIEQRGHEVYIPVLKLAKANHLQTIIFEIIKDYNFTPQQVAEVQKLLKSDSGKYVISSTHRILKNRNWLIISENAIADNTFYLIETENAQINIGANKLTVAKVPLPLALDTDLKTCYINADEVEFPLIIRRYKTGDYFYPLGMSKKKKLSRFFGDLKLSLLQKENVWIVESNKKIVWVIGYRIDDRFKIKANSIALKLNFVNCLAN